MKNCLKKEILFDYYHKSLDTDLMKKIGEHIAHCKCCQHSLDLLINEITLTKDSLEFINPDIKEIPEFKISNEKIIKKINYSRVLSWAASICLLITISTLTFIKIIDNQKPVNDYEYFNYVPDMNDAWKENSITVTRYDNNGNPIDHKIIGN